MRVRVQYEVVGSTIDELVQNANMAWHALTDDDEDLPASAELHIVENEATDYKATVYAQTQIATT